jgi:predicted phosphoribosyltransferase
MTFKNRTQAGNQLLDEISRTLTESQKKLSRLFAIPAGGVPIAEEISNSLKLKIELLIVEKLGTPINSEFYFGAIAANDVAVYDGHIVESLGIRDTEIDDVESDSRKILREKITEYSAISESDEILESDTVLVVDDGVITGQTALAAVKFLESIGAKSIWFATPIADKDSLAIIEAETDKVICLETKSELSELSGFYKSYPKVSKLRIKKILDE